LELVDLQRRRDQILQGRVVDFAGDAPPLVVLRPQELRRDAPDFALGLLKRLRGLLELVDVGGGAEALGWTAARVADLACMDEEPPVAAIPRPQPDLV